MFWTSVDDELPENGYRYLAVLDGCTEVLLFCDDGYWCKTLDSVHLAGRVTYWMPLPEPPN